MLANVGDGLPVVVVQFAKIKIFAGSKLFGWNAFFFIIWCMNLFFIFLGKMSIQNVLSATRIYVNPSIPEIVCLKEV
jgi:hypothetical protein